MGFLYRDFTVSQAVKGWLAGLSADSSVVVSDGSPASSWPGNTGYESLTKVPYSSILLSGGHRVFSKILNPNTSNPK